MIRRVSVEEIEKDLSAHLEVAAEDYVAIARQGKAVGLLLSLDDPADWWEELLLHNPIFVNRIAEARQSLREGKGIAIEELRSHPSQTQSPQTQSPEVSIQ